MRKVDFRSAFFCSPQGRVSSCPAAELLTRWNVRACCPNNGQRVAAGRRGTPRLPEPTTFLFFVKDCTFVVSGPSFVRRDARVGCVRSRRRRVWCFWPAKRARCPRKHVGTSRDGAAGDRIAAQTTWGFSGRQC